MAKHTKEFRAAVKAASKIVDKLDTLNERINGSDNASDVLKAFNTCRQNYAALAAESKGWGSLASIALGRLTEEFSVDPYESEEAITDADIDAVLDVIGGGSGNEAMACEVARVLNAESGVNQGDIGDGTDSLAALLAALGMPADDVSEEDEDADMVAASDEGFYSDDENDDDL